MRNARTQDIGQRRERRQEVVDFVVAMQEGFGDFGIVDAGKTLPGEKPLAELRRGRRRRT